ncbi:MAG TPA: hypothetical protein VLS96_21965 [Nodosilinea sp.]|nr:hypothetical protein [Nodosilinea sp.]
MEELEQLGESDADNDIARRTEFIIELYEDNTDGLGDQDIRQVYEAAFSQRFKQREAEQTRRRVGWTALGLAGLTAGTFAIAKRKILKVKRASVSLPFGIGEMELETVETSRNAAWALYVEMTTRIATQQLDDDHGLLREALASLYVLFGITRQILKDAGPDVGATPESVGGIATAVLNQGLRPFLAKWHPQLQRWEAQRPDGMSPKEHESHWPDEATMRQELAVLGKKLEQYTNALAKIAGAPFLPSAGAAP